MKQEEFTYFKLNELSLKATVYRSESPTKNQTILYFHGGGLIYGSRTDIQESYISSFLESGFHFISFDYPLAPESSLEDIYTSVKEAVKWFLNEVSHSLQIDSSDYILFGRSAGAYLCFLLARNNSLPSPEKIINFYGYDSLAYNEFKEPSAYYSNYTKIPETLIKQMIQTQPIASGSIQTRYALYLYARQTGKWLDFLHVTKYADQNAQLTKKEAEMLPPTFIAHSADDNDVPYYIAECLYKTIPHSTLHTVYNMEHDFDREPTSIDAQKAYAVLLDWLQKNK